MNIIAVDCVLRQQPSCRPEAAGQPNCVFVTKE
jgi:hypothetical protein